MGFQNAFALGAFLTIVVGLLVGVVAGALPGISFVNAMAMALPFTYVMTPTNAMLFLGGIRSEEHTSELQSLMRISYAVFCLKKQKQIQYLISTKKPTIQKPTHN